MSKKQKLRKRVILEDIWHKTHGRVRPSNLKRFFNDYIEKKLSNNP